MTSVAGSIRTRVLNVGPLAFTAREAGEGPLVLMIHGFPDEPATFDAQLLALARAGYHVVAPTLRGYERSSRPTDASYRLVDLASDVTGWMDALETQSAHLVGHDWGATVACRRRGRSAGTRAQPRHDRRPTTAGPVQGDRARSTPDVALEIHVFLPVRSCLRLVDAKAPRRGDTAALAAMESRLVTLARAHGESTSSLLGSCHRARRTDLLSTGSRQDHGQGSRVHGFAIWDGPSTCAGALRPER